MDKFLCYMTMVSYTVNLWNKLVLLQRVDITSFTRIFEWFLNIDPDKIICLYRRSKAYCVAIFLPFDYRYQRNHSRGDFHQIKRMAYLAYQTCRSFVTGTSDQITISTALFNLIRIRYQLHRILLGVQTTSKAE